MPSACSIWASIWRESRVNSRSPSATLAPSSKCAATMVVSSRDLSATLEIGVTVPIESTSTGTGLRSAVASSTETTRGRCGPCALAPVPIHDERVTKAAASAPTTRTPPQIIKLRFFITSHVNRSTRDRDGPVFPTLDGDLCALCSWLITATLIMVCQRNENLSLLLPDHAMRIATWNVNSIRQRIDHLLTWLRDCAPDIVCLQEIKC